MKTALTALVGLAGATLTATLPSAQANAQAVSIVTTNPGSFTHSTAAAIAKAMVQHGGIRATVSPQQSHGQEAVNDGSADLSLATISDVQQYVTGTMDYAGKGTRQNIRLLSRVVPIRTAGLVKVASDIKTLKDVKGKRAPSEYPAQRSVYRVMQGQLATVGLTIKDVKPVPTRNIISSADDFAAGKTDIFWFALGSAKVKQVAAGVGGLRAVSIETGPAARTAMRKFVPGSYPLQLKPSKQLEEIREPIWAMAYDVVFFAGPQMSDDMAYRITKVMFENKKDMASVFGALNGFDPARMATAYDDLVYHPGAIRFFKEKGQWPPKSID